VTGDNARGIQIGGSEHGTAYRNMVTGVVIESAGDEGVTITDYSSENIVQGCLIKSTGCIGIRILSTGEVVSDNVIQNNYIIDSGANGGTDAGIQVDAAANKTVVKGNVISGSTGYGIAIISTATNTAVSGNTYEDNASGNLYTTVSGGNDTSLGGGEVECGLVTTPYAVTNAATLPLPYPSDFFTITTPGTVTAFAAAGTTIAGRKVTIKALGAATITHNTSIFLNGGIPFVMAVNDTLSLVCDGTNWYETGRMVI